MLNVVAQRGDFSQKTNWSNSDPWKKETEPPENDTGFDFPFQLRVTYQVMFYILGKKLIYFEYTFI